ncbi:hypothetical protein J437_LFUL016261 [Ladona fulva]|uniref:Uncharacterized protein n=1 Tax=Ladona fulva TaxID=123851 RepID=A0A8K0P8C2_LADFU|nr:hypothetical protein J437_LFUL016261 [Ladona fulva]
MCMILILSNIFSLGSHKQLITEEKMAARLSEIHISSNFAVQQTVPAAATSETKISVGWV